MANLVFPSSLVVRTITLSDDSVHPLANEDIPFYSLDIQCLENSVKIGVGGNMDFVLNAGDVYWTYNANMRDFSFQNHNAGFNGKVVCIATVPNKFVKENLEAMARGY